MSWDAEVEKLAKRIEAKCGCRVKHRFLEKSGKWAFDAPKNFAHARKRQEAKCLRISTKEDWAIRAGVNEHADGRSPRGHYPGGRAAVYWDMQQSSAQSLEWVSSMLAKVCESRHR